MSDQQLTDLVRSHHRELVAHVGRGLRATADAEDIVQETWIRAARVMAAQSRGGPVVNNLRALLFRIAGNLSIDHLRRKRVRRHLEADDLDSTAAMNATGEASDAESAILHRESEAALVAALGRLPVRASKVLILSRVEGWTYPRIAAHLDVSLRTVSNDMQAALRECLLALADSGR